MEAHGTHQGRGVPGPVGPPSYDNRGTNIWLSLTYSLVSPPYPLKLSLGSEVLPHTQFYSYAFLLQQLFHTKMPLIKVSVL